MSRGESDGGTYDDERGAQGIDCRAPRASRLQRRESLVDVTDLSLCWMCRGLPTQLARNSVDLDADNFIENGRLEGKEEEFEGGYCAQFGTPTGTVHIYVQIHQNSS